MIPDYVTKAAIQIYNMEFAMKCEIVEQKDMEITVRITLGKCDMIRQNDPVVFQYMDNDVFQCRSAVAQEVDYRNCIIRLYVAEDFGNEERRVFERFPVSLEASARKKYQNRRINLIVKNLSLYGLGVVSSADIDIDELIDIDLITKRNMLYFTAKVVWKKELKGNENNYEYGIHIKDVDVATINILDEYLKKLRSVYVDMYDKAK
jgi:hypothetical protein